MSISRRNLIKLGALAGASDFRSRAMAAPPSQAVGKPLRILILGGTGFIGPHQVRYAVAEVTRSRSSIAGSARPICRPRRASQG